MMSFDTKFKEAVGQKDTLQVRIMLKNCLLLASEKDFNEMLSYAQRELPTLVDVHDGEEPKPRKEWNRAYLDQQMVRLVSNFSRERIHLLQEMVTKLYGERPPRNGGPSTGKGGRLKRALKRAAEKVAETGKKVLNVYKDTKESIRRNFDG